MRGLISKLKFYLNPIGWGMLYPYNDALDDLFKYYLMVYDVELISDYRAKLGPLTLCIANKPYGFKVISDGHDGLLNGYRPSKHYIYLVFKAVEQLESNIQKNHEAEMRKAVRSRIVKDSKADIEC